MTDSVTRGMSKTAKQKMILLLCAFSIFSCDSKQSVESKYEDSPNQNIDIASMATPNGDKLGPAQQGPIRNALGQPQVTIESYRLVVEGLVDSTLSYSYGDLLKLQSEQSDTMLMYCVEGWEVYGNWHGVPVIDLLFAAGVNPKATHVTFHGIDGYTTTLSLKYLNKYKTLLAYKVNDLWLFKEDGFPLRLTVPGLFGYKWAKYVNRLEVIDKPFLGFWEQRGYGDRAIVPLDRRQFYEGKNAEIIEF